MGVLFVVSSADMTIQRGHLCQDRSGCGKGLPHLGLKTSVHGGACESCLTESSHGLTQSHRRHRLQLTHPKKAGHLDMAAGSLSTAS